MIPRLLELTTLFLKIGSISFGGPAAHLAMMEHEVVKRRRWLSRQEFLDLIGATHLIPGPNAVELAAHIGYCRAGPAGSLAAGLAFTLPAVLITAVFAYCYVQYGTMLEKAAFLQGIQPAILAVIFAAVWRLGQKALRRWQLVLVGLSVALAVVVFDRVEIPALFAGAALGVLLLTFSKVPDSSRPNDTDDDDEDHGDHNGDHNGDNGGDDDRQGVPPQEGSGKKLGAIAGLTAVASSSTAKAAAGVAAGAVAGAGATVSLWWLGLFFAKVGAVMFGGGYVLIAYLEGGLVGADPQLITEEQLLDAIAIGQLTPGPLLTTATFVGYLIAGWPGAIVATIGILTPSFFLVTATNPLIPRMRKSRWMSRFLDAVNAASIGLMAAVTLKLSYLLLWNVEQSRLDGRALLLAVVAGFLAVRFKLTPAWLVLGGALAGWFFW